MIYQLINSLTFFQGHYSGLHRAYFSSISIKYKWDYAYSFCQIFQGLRLFQTHRVAGMKQVYEDLIIINAQLLSMFFLGFSKRK